jgi:hypothetical protein
VIFLLLWVISTTSNVVISPFVVGIHSQQNFLFTEKIVVKFYPKKFELSAQFVFGVKINQIFFFCSTDSIQSDYLVPMSSLSPSWLLMLQFLTTARPLLQHTPKRPKRTVPRRSTCSTWSRPGTRVLTWIISSRGETFTEIKLFVSAKKVSNC